MNTHRAAEVQRHTVLTFFQLGSEWVSLTAQALYPREKIPDTFWIGRCLGLRGGLDAVVRRIGLLAV